MPSLRSDAARSRALILDAARAQDIHTLRLNEVARGAGVGVGTVYRHFPNVQALVEALASDTVERMLDVTRLAAAEPDPRLAFEEYIRSALELLLEFDGLQTVLLSTDDETGTTRAAKEEIFGTFAGVLERAQAAGAVRSDLTLDQLAHLACGVEYAVRLGSPADRNRFLDILIAGVKPT